MSPVKGMTLNEAIEIMRGPKGSKIELSIGRPGESQPFDSHPGAQHHQGGQRTRHSWLEPGYGYIRIAQFQNSTAARMCARRWKN